MAVTSGRSTEAVAQAVAEAVALVTWRPLRWLDPLDRSPWVARRAASLMGAPPPGAAVLVSLLSMASHVRDPPCQQAALVVHTRAVGSSSHGWLKRTAILVAVNCIEQ